MSDIDTLRGRINKLRNTRAQTEGQKKSAEEELDRLKKDCVTKFEVKSTKALHESIEKDQQTLDKAKTDLEQTVQEWEHHAKS